MVYGGMVSEAKLADWEIFSDLASAVFGDTGPVPLAETEPFPDYPNFTWLRGPERRLLKAESFPFQRGIYVGAVANVRSAAHREDLADLYCPALQLYEEFSDLRRLREVSAGMEARIEPLCAKSARLGANSSKSQSTAPGPPRTFQSSSRYPRGFPAFSGSGRNIPRCRRHIGSCT